MAIDEDIITLAPIALVLVLFLVALFNILVDFQTQQSRYRQIEVAFSISQIIPLNSSGVVKESALPSLIFVNSSEYSVHLNLTDLQRGTTWVSGHSNGGAVSAVPVLIERLNGEVNPAKLIVRVGAK